MNRADLIDRLLNDCHEKGIFNGTALIADEGEIVLESAYGLKNIQTAAPLDSKDKFYIGSITKQFTSMLIFQLYDQQRLNIYAPFCNYLPEFKAPPFSEITVYQLLTHTSGIKNFTSFSEFDASADISEAEMFEMIKRPLSFTPGTNFEYSNSGYYLLGKIIERMSAKTFGEALEENIFGPLKMENSGFDTVFHYTDFARGYWRTIDGMAPMPQYEPKTLFSTGGIYSTVGDLFKWNQALYESQLLSDSAKKIMFEPFKNDYACGWRVHKGYDDDGEYFERHQHGGTIKGYHCFILRRIPEKQTVILLDNFYDQEIQEIKNAIWTILIDRKGHIPQAKLSNLLFQAAADQNVKATIQAITENDGAYRADYHFEEYDINTVAYRLMDANRFDEAELIFEFNQKLYPHSWNVYDSYGELQLRMGNLENSKALYLKSLDLNPKNESAKQALDKITQMEAQD